MTQQAEPHGFNGYTTLSRSTYRALEETDNMPGPLRACVHEFGYPIVRACLDVGVKEPRHIRHLVDAIWSGARHKQQKSRQGRQGSSNVLDFLDWVLIQAGANINAHRLLQVLWKRGMVIVPLEPTDPQIAASIATVANHDQKLTKREKHLLRLRAATRAATKHLFPHLQEK